MTRPGAPIEVVVLPPLTPIRKLRFRGWDLVDNYFETFIILTHFKDLSVNGFDDTCRKHLLELVER